MSGTGKFRARIKARVAQPIDNRLWRLWPRNPAEYCFYRRTDLQEIARFYPELNLAALRARDRLQYDFLLERFTAYSYDLDLPLIIEPLRGWLIPRLFNIFKWSFPLINDPWDSIKPRPSTLGYVTKRNLTVLDCAISVSFCWHNYYHFFVDTLAQFHLLDSQGVPRDVPVIVPETFSSTPFVRQFIEMSSFLRDREFIVQRRGDYIRVLRHTFIAKNTFYSNAIFSAISELKLRDKAAESSSRLYVRRDPTGPRGTQNEEEISAIARDHGFQVVDTSRLSLQEQIDLFSSAEVLAGTHGAGLTNMLFSKRKPLRVLEIFPADLTPEHYRNLALLCGCEYDSLIAGPMDNQGRFRVDPVPFKNALSRYV